MTSLSFHIIYLSVVCVCIIIPTSSQPQKHVELFIFGDSFFDARNNNFIIPPLIIKQISGHMGKPSLTTPLEEFLMATLMDRKQFSISILFSLQLYLKSLPDPKNKKTQNMEIQNFLILPNIK